MVLKDMQLFISPSDSDLTGSPRPNFIPKYRQKTHPAWRTILSYFDLKEIIRVQGVSLQFSILVNPSQEECLVDFEGWFGIRGQRQIQYYGSILGLV